MLFARAASLGLSPADNAYYRASNALFDGNAPYANELAREAKRLDPDNPRTDELLDRAQQRFCGPEPRSALTAGQIMPGAVLRNTNLRLPPFCRRISLPRLRFPICGGRAITIRCTAMLWASNALLPFKQHWLDLMVRDVQPDSGSSFMEARAAWRGVYSVDPLRINGPYTLSYSRQSIETAESVKKGVYADRLGLNTEARILDWGVLQAEIFGTQRTDGNRTVGGTVSPRYIVWDKPQPDRLSVQRHRQRQESCRLLRAAGIRQSYGCGLV